MKSACPSQHQWKLGSFNNSRLLSMWLYPYIDLTFFCGYPWMLFSKIIRVPLLQSCLAIQSVPLLLPCNHHTLHKLLKYYLSCQLRYVSLFLTVHFPVDTGRKLNVHKTFRRRPERLMYLQITSCVQGVTNLSCNSTCTINIILAWTQ